MSKKGWGGTDPQEKERKKKKKLFKTKTKGTTKNKKPSNAAIYALLLLEITARRIFVSI